MIANGALAYRRTQVQTASPVQLIVQLYEGTIRFLERAIQALEQREYEQAHNLLVRAQAIIAELRATLNPEAGPIAEQLDILYGDLHRQLVLVNVRKDAGAGREVLGYLRELLSAWQTIARSGEPTVTLQ